MNNIFQLLSEIIDRSHLRVGDTILVGRFRNRPAKILSFKKDKNNQPQVKTDKGTYSLYRFRIKKLMPPK